MKLSQILQSKIVAVVALSVLLPVTAFASGGGSYGGGGGGGSSYQPARQVDQTYEVGKAIFNGRQSGYPKISYCVVSGEQKLPVKSKTLKPYKGQSYNEFASHLYNCDNPDSLVSSELSSDGLLHILYYLNKRYKMRLKSSSSY